MKLKHCIQDFALNCSSLMPSYLIARFHLIPLSSERGESGIYCLWWGIWTASATRVFMSYLKASYISNRVDRYCCYCSLSLSLSLSLSQVEVEVRPQLHSFLMPRAPLMRAKFAPLGVALRPVSLRGTSNQNRLPLIAMGQGWHTLDCVAYGDIIFL